LADAENAATSAERLMFLMGVAAEAALVVPEHRPPTEWPTLGEIKFEGVDLCYRPGLPLTLKNLTLTVPAATKRVGIVGRTGCGKSTLFKALFRMVEPSAGKISIDGVDILQLGLRDLRSRLTMLPQEPTLFAGSVRYNVDPTMTHKDEEIWAVLERVQMVEAVRAFPEGLEHTVSTAGSNLSVGQCQLLCFARAWLQKPRLFLMDEATASIDHATEALIQQSLRELEDVTIIVIAHRLTTVLECDLVLVMDEGAVIEYGTPSELSAKSGGAFSELLKRADLAVER
jgi:ABC-type multidrug transport system fused ATPase/permease subunit